MAMKQSGRKVYKSANGKTVDMDMLRQRYELTPAVGNARVNARGDELGKGGKIIRNKEDVVREYYEASQASIRDEVIQAPAEPKPAPTATKKSAAKKASNKKDDVNPGAATDDWVEDEDGNFIQKGE